MTEEKEDANESGRVGKYKPDDNNQHRKIIGYFSKNHILRIT